MDVGDNLNIASQQDTDQYTVRSSSAGGTIGIGPNMGSTISAGKSKTDSNYQSVNEQSGIYAGKGGFDINIGKNTDLKDAVISSSEATPDKNKLSTDTLTYSDIQNKADYSSSSVGVNYNSDLKPGMKLGDLGLTPNIGVKVSGDADSTTKADIAPKWAFLWFLTRQYFKSIYTICDNGSIILPAGNVMLPKNLYAA